MISVSEIPEKHEKSGKRKAGRPKEATSLHAARTRKERALAQLREMEVEEKRAELVSASDVAREWEGIIRNVRSAMLAVVSRVRSQLPGLDAHAVSVLDREIRAALAALGEPPAEEPPAPGDA